MYSTWWLFTVKYTFKLNLSVFQWKNLQVKLKSNRWIFPVSLSIAHLLTAFLRPVICPVYDKWWNSTKQLAISLISPLCQWQVTFQPQMCSFPFLTISIHSAEKYSNLFCIKSMRTNQHQYINRNFFFFYI